MFTIFTGKLLVQINLKYFCYISTTLDGKVWPADLITIKTKKVCSKKLVLVLLMLFFLWYNLPLFKICLKSDPVINFSPMLSMISNSSSFIGRHRYFLLDKFWPNLKMQKLAKCAYCTCSGYFQYQEWSQN